MDNIKIALLQLTHNAEIEISKLKLPFEFSKIGLPTNPFRKFSGDISHYVYNYFKNEDYEVEVVNSLEAIIQYINMYGQKIKISILFYEPCWRLEYIYRIFYGDIKNWVSYYCNFEEVVEMEKAFENIVFVTKYIQHEVDDKFNTWLKENGKIM